MSRDINELMVEALEKAKELVTGDRQKDYGTPQESFRRIAAFWSAYLGIDLSEEQVAIMMALLKIARSAGGKKTNDTYYDLLGYGAIAYALRTPDKRKGEGKGKKMSDYKKSGLLSGITALIEAMAIQAEIEGMKANDSLDEVIHCGSYPEAAYIEKAAELRKIAGRLLDGREYLEVAL